MKILLIALALLVAVEAKAYQWAHGPNIQNGRGNNPPRGPSWMQQQDQNIFGPNVEWVCQSPKTNDMMIIATDNTQQQHPGRGSWKQWQNIPPGLQKHQQNSWPIIIVEERPNDNQISPSIPLNNNNNNDNQPKITTPHYHGGEGLIDVRMGV